MSSPLPFNWYPFRSKEVKEIYRHMTPEEVKQLRAFGIRHGTRSGLIIGLAAALSSSIGPSLTWGWPLYAQFVVAFSTTALATLTVAYFGLKGTRRQARELLCSTLDARQQGFTSQTLRLYSLER